MHTSCAEADTGKRGGETDEEKQRIPTSAQSYLLPSCLLADGCPASQGRVFSEQEADSQHLCFCLLVVLIGSYPREILDRLLECPEGEDVRDRVSTLVRWSLVWVGGARSSLGVGDGGVRLEGMEEDIESG